MKCYYYWFYASPLTVSVISKGLIVMQDIILPQLSQKKIIEVTSKKWTTQ